MTADEVLGAAFDEVVGATIADAVEYVTGALDVPTAAEELDSTTAVLVGTTGVDDGGAAELLGLVYGVGVGSA
jgi:hypothetical protein